MGEHVAAQRSIIAGGVLRPVPDVAPGYCPARADAVGPRHGYPGCEGDKCGDGSDPHPSPSLLPSSQSRAANPAGLYASLLIYTYPF